MVTDVAVGLGKLGTVGPVTGVSIEGVVAVGRGVGVGCLSGA